MKIRTLTDRKKYDLTFRISRKSFPNNLTETRFRKHIIKNLGLKESKTSIMFPIQGRFSMFYTGITEREYAKISSRYLSYKTNGRSKLVPLIREIIVDQYYV